MMSREGRDSRASDCHFGALIGSSAVHDLRCIARHSLVSHIRIATAPLSLSLDARKSILFVSSAA